MVSRNYAKAIQLFLGLGLAATVAACGSGEQSPTTLEEEPPAVEPAPAVEPVPDAPDAATSESNGEDQDNEDGKDQDNEGGEGGER